MSENRIPPSVLVGIDGSDAAVGAAHWAIDEAVSRRVPLRLLYVLRAAHPSADAYSAAVDHAKAALRIATAAVEGTGKPVKVETAILQGPPGAVLVEESAGAEMICVGTVGIGRYARSILGSTAAELAEKAHCPVAVIRSPEEEPPQRPTWIVVAVSDQPGNEAVVEAAMQEATLRRDPVLLLGRKQTLVDPSGDALDRQVQKWTRRHPGVHIYPIANRADVAHFVKKHDEPVELAVIGARNAGDLAQIIGQHHRISGHTALSALVVRH